MVLKTLIHERRIRDVRTALKGGPNMNHRIDISRQNSHQNIRPADHKRLITNTAKNENHNMTVLELTQKYISTRTNVRPTTKIGYQTVVNILKNDSFGKESICNIRISEAKLWFIRLQKGGKRYSSIHAIKGVLKPAFQLAVDDDCIQKSPFSFDLSSVIANDSKTREGLNSKDEKRFLEYIKADPHFCRYYEGIYILFKTGLRISEFCGLTFKDVDFKKHCIRINHQINKRGKGFMGYESTIKIYKCESCEGCPYYGKCYKGQYTKSIQVSEVFDAFRQESRDNITSEKGIQLRVNRSIQAEGVFGITKQDYGFKRFLMRGKENVATEYTLLAIAFDLNKLHNRIQSGRIGQALYPLSGSA